MSESSLSDAAFDRSVDYYYTNLVNALVLFSMKTTELEALEGPAFDALFELWSEADYAFNPVCFETLFRTKRVDASLREALLQFKRDTDDIPDQMWDWPFIDKHTTWIAVRQKANLLLDQLGVTSRTYNDDFVTVYDKDGSVLKKGKKLN